jgi:VanZ family protein
MKKNLNWARAFALSVILIILAGSSVPGQSIPRVFELTPDKLIHCLEYAVLGFFLFRWLSLELPSLAHQKINALTFFCGSLMGIIDENYQRLTPGRSPDFWDWVLDSVGVILAILMMNFIIKRK